MKGSGTSEDVEEQMWVHGWRAGPRLKRRPVSGHGRAYRTTARTRRQASFKKLGNHPQRRVVRDPHCCTAVVLPVLACASPAPDCRSRPHPLRRLGQRLRPPGAPRPPQGGETVGRWASLAAAHQRRSARSASALSLFEASPRPGFTFPRWLSGAVTRRFSSLRRRSRVAARKRPPCSTRQ